MRAFVATTTDLVQEAHVRHDTSATASAALGRTLTATLLLGATLKEGESVTVRVMGDGPIGGIISEADPAGHVRGYAQEPHADLPARPDGKLDVSGIVGLDGFIHVTRDLLMGQPYTGSAPLVSGEIAEDVSNYFLVSEQTPSAVALGVLVDTDLTVRAAGGFFLQAMPGAPAETLSALEENIGLLPSVSAAIDSGLTPEGILKLAFTGIEYDILGRTDLSFACRCDRERVIRALVSLGPAELQEIAAEDKPVELVCHFCGERYTFTPAEVTALIEPKSDHLH